MKYSLVILAMLEERTALFDVTRAKDESLCTEMLARAST